MTESLLTAEQAGAILGVEASWVLQKAREGRIPHVRLGRYVRFEEDALRVWITQKRCGPAVAV
jgi:excisionase family DNA binding protein